jgi:hypothetical protein
VHHEKGMLIITITLFAILSLRVVRWLDAASIALRCIVVLFHGESTVKLRSCSYLHGPQLLL